MLSYCVFFISRKLVGVRQSLIQHKAFRAVCRLFTGHAVRLAPHAYEGNGAVRQLSSVADAPVPIALAVEHPGSSNFSGDEPS